MPSPGEVEPADVGPGDAAGRGGTGSWGVGAWPAGLAGGLDPPDAALLDDYAGLRDAELRRRRELVGVPGAPHGCFVAEGVLVVRRLLTSDYPVRSVLATEARLAELAPELDACRSEPVVFLASRATLRAVAGFDVHRGVLAVGARRAPEPLDTLLAGISRRSVLVVAEGLVDHENLGALFRNAAALGADGVVLCPRSADPLYRRSLRVSMGAVLGLPWRRATSWPGALDDLRRAGFAVAALDPRPDAEPLDSWAARRPDRVALVVGTEGPGLTDDVRRAADAAVRVPMPGAERPGALVDSLNVATAAAVALAGLVR